MHVSNYFKQFVLYSCTYCDSPGVAAPPMPTSAFSAFSVELPSGDEEELQSDGVSQQEKCRRAGGGRASAPVISLLC